jgi:hypothetical protein
MSFHLCYIGFVIFAGEEIWRIPYLGINGIHCSLCLTSFNYEGTSLMPISVLNHIFLCSIDYSFRDQMSGALRI